VFNYLLYKRPNAHLIVATDCIVSFSALIKDKVPKYKIILDRDLLLNAGGGVFCGH